MNQWITVVLVGILVSAMGMLLVDAIIFILIMIGALMTLSFVVAVWKFGQKMYPITVNIFTDKRGGIEFDYSKRAKRIKKGDNKKYFLSLTSGEEIPDPGRKFQITGDAGVIYNLYTNNYMDFSPFEMVINKETKEYKNSLVPIADRQWIADQLRINKRITNKPNPMMERFMLVAPILVVCIFCGLTYLLFAMGMEQFAAFICK